MNRETRPYVYPAIEIQPLLSTDIITISGAESGDGKWIDYEELF